MTEEPKGINNNEKKRKPSKAFIDSLKSPSIEEISRQTSEIVDKELQNLKNSREEE
jgi:hypothetical protein